MSAIREGLGANHIRYGGAFQKCSPPIFANVGATNAQYFGPIGLGNWAL